MGCTSGAIDRRGFLAFAGTALLATSAPSVVGATASVTTVSGRAFGTQWTVTLPDSARVAGLSTGLHEMLGNVDQAFSPWRADSLVGRFNRAEADETVAPDEVVSVVRTALEISAGSDGYFDPTVGPMVARWGFGPIDTGQAPPDGWRHVRAENGHVTRDISGLTLDFCGIAKGHALDRMATLLLEAGHEHFLVDLGGEVAARGRHPSGRPWQVGLENPLVDRDGLEAVLRLDGMAVATSGDRRNGYDIGGRRYSHIIDPTAREPVASRLASVSVVMPLAIKADGWATALMAAGDAGPALARRHDIAALFLFRDGDGLKHVATGDISRHLL